MKKSMVLAALFAWWLEIYTPSPGGPPVVRRTVDGPYDSEEACKVKQEEFGKIPGVVVGACSENPKWLDPPSVEIWRSEPGVKGPPQIRKVPKRGVK